MTDRSDLAANAPETQRVSITRRIIDSLAQFVDDTKFKLAGLRGRGYPKPRSWWDERYREGAWRYLDSAGEVAHYMIVLGYVQQLSANPAVLDVGCGHGRLLQLLQRYPYRSYLGIDHSEECIRQAQHLAGSNARFERADFAEFIPAERYDAIVFNESIYYASRPADVLQRYMSALNKDGVMIVSMCQNRWQRSIWNTLESVAEMLHSTAVTSENDLTWHVRVLRPV